MGGMSRWVVGNLGRWYLTRPPCMACNGSDTRQIGVLRGCRSARPLYISKLYSFIGSHESSVNTNKYTKLVMKKDKNSLKYRRHT